MIEKRMKCRLALSGHSQENIWHVDSGGSKHVNGEKIKFTFLK